MSPVAQISRLLVGVAFDEASASALKTAEVLASTLDADITVFHSSTPEAPAYFTADQIEALEAEREQSRAGTADQLRFFAGQHVRRAVHVVVGEGPPENGLIRMAADFDLIVVGTHRRHGARRWWLGSVAEAVVRRSPRPVLVVPAGAAVLEARRTFTILAAGGNVAAADAWVNVLRRTFAANVVRSPDISQCAPDRVQSTDLIVLSMPADSETHFGAIVQVLKECVHPVLFVPSTDGIVERSLS
jgi:nucleotide-binding universal stress UspA family protein